MWQEAIAVHFRALPRSFALTECKKYEKRQSELSVTLPRFEPDTFRMQVWHVMPCSLVDVHKHVVPSLHHHEDGGSWLLWNTGIMYPSQKVWICISTAAGVSDVTSMTVAYCEVFSSLCHVQPASWREFELTVFVLQNRNISIPHER
jgi:hypothetical protein